MELSEIDKVHKPKRPRAKKVAEAVPATEPVVDVELIAIEKPAVRVAKKKPAIKHSPVSAVKKKKAPTPRELVEKAIAENADYEEPPAYKPSKNKNKNTTEESIGHNIEVPSPDYLAYNDQARPVRPIGVYKKIAFAFVFLTVALLVAVFYFSFVRISITLIPNKERVSNNLIFDVYDAAKNQSPRQGVVVGAVREIEVSQSKKFEPSTAEVIGEEVVGKVTIFNKYSKNQPLVATTRLLSADNKLFRIKDTVNVPAGGSLEVDAYADKPSESMAISGQTSWTIPGLWAGLQDKIYGESKGPMVYQKKTKKIISQSDIDNGTKTLKAALVDKTKESLADIYKSYNQVIYNLDDNSVAVKVGAKVGEEKSDFPIEVKAKVKVVAFNDDQIANLAEEKINATIPNTKELVDFQKDKIVYSLNNSDLKQGVATVNAIFEGMITLKKDATIVEKEKIVGLTKDQLKEYLSSLPELAGSEVKFYPSFISKVPDLVDRINITVKE